VRCKNDKFPALASQEVPLAAIAGARKIGTGAMLPPFSGRENSNEDLRLIGTSPDGRMGGIARVEAILSNFGFDAG
jgi:hypothetical protein